MKIFQVVFVSIVIAILSFTSCKNNNTIPTSPSTQYQIPNTIKYAQGFTIESFQGFKKLTITAPYQKSKKQYEYVLVPKGNPIPENVGSATVIQTPVSRVVVTSVSHIPMLELLGEANSLIGFPNTDFISSKKVRTLIDAGKIKELGKGEILNVEVLLEAKPALVVSFALDASDRTFNTLKKTGIPVLLNGDWLENTPLGRAEWIQFFGVLFQKEKEADSIFKGIEERYLAAKHLAMHATINKPSVFSGTLFEGIWDLPSGESFMAQLFQDAGLNYLWKETKGKGSLALSFEHVFEKAQQADIWMAPSLFASKDELNSANPHYNKFAAFKNNRVYTFANKKGETGGLLYFELSTAHPDWVLKDIIHIAHPELMSGYIPYFFEEME